MTINTEQFMKKLFLLFLFSAFMVGKCLASDFNDGTLNYTILSGTTNVQVDGLSNSSATTATIPATVSNGGTTYNVTSIKEYAFYKSGLASIDLSQATNLQTIGANAFCDCISTDFKTTIGTTAVKYNALTFIGNSAFGNCYNLTVFDISRAKGLTSIENAAFCGCSNLESVPIPESVASIGNSAFSGCTKLASVTIPASVTSIGKSAFNGCSYLQSVDLTQATNLKTIGEYAVAFCEYAAFATTFGGYGPAVKYNNLTY